eukprot:TRINITY_DN30342_c0_g1_i1.p1 TRINITY_DN30342_c0_g1~~TRINITY_DN30342_c0_g1_i1.p1  ORF type:complete len:231 (+),score=53.28 TRINITY_DN30342_c0_g1_i1:272-964(+)
MEKRFSSEGEDGRDNSSEAADKARVPGREDPKYTDEQVESDWRAAMLFLTKGPSATLEFLKEEPRVWLHAYRVQALDGSASPDETGAQIQDSAARKRLEAWQALRGMPQIEAKRRYTNLLSSVLPSWREWYADQKSIFNQQRRVRRTRQQQQHEQRASERETEERGNEGRGIAEGEGEGDGSDVDGADGGQVAGVSVAEEGLAEKLLREFREKTGLAIERPQWPQLRSKL